MDDDQAPAPFTNRRWDAVKNRLSDTGRWARITPGLAAAAVCAEGVALHGQPLSSAAAIAAVGAGGLVIGWNQVGAKGRVYVCAIAAYASAWAAAVSAHGEVSWRGPGDGLLLAGAALLATPWSYGRRWRYEEPDELPELPALEEISEFQQIWRDYVNIPGAVLEPEWPVPGGWQTDIVVPRGRMATEDIIAKSRHIRSAYDVAPTQCVVEPTPDQRSTRARLTVLERDELAVPRIWGGATLDPETGLYVAGSFMDGAPARGQLFVPGSGPSDHFVAGTKGSGKSRFLDKLAAEIHLTPLGVLWVNDPQEGHSLSDWIKGAADYALGGEEIGFDACMKQLRALRRIVYRRSAYFGREIVWVDRKGRERKGGKTYFDPTSEIPFLYDLLDEVHVLVKNADPEIRKEAVALLGDISKLSRKAGVGIAYVAHQVGLDEMGGSKASATRSMLREGTTVAFRTGDGTSHSQLGLKADPSKLPQFFADGSKTQGLGYIKGPDARPGAQFRAEYVDDPFEIACTPAAGRLDDMSLEAAAEPDDAERAPMHFSVPGILSIPSAAERKTWAEQILPKLVDGEDHTFGAIWKSFPAGTSDRSIRHGLRSLVDDELVATDGDKKPYFITDAGRAALEQRSAVA
ncbi:MAG: hypothetical protein JWN52_6715 [Actinomycetia bacterium]|nr:hypothetical protein [Actinomycetes bacterium]